MEAVHDEGRMKVLAVAAAAGTTAVVVCTAVAAVVRRAETAQARQ